MDFVLAGFNASLDVRTFQENLGDLKNSVDLSLCTLTIFIFTLS